MRAMFKQCRTLYGALQICHIVVVSRAPVSHAFRAMSITRVPRQCPKNIAFYGGAIRTCRIAVVFQSQLCFPSFSMTLVSHESSIGLPQLPSESAVARVTPMQSQDSGVCCCVSTTIIIARSNQAFFLQFYFVEISRNLTAILQVPMYQWVPYSPCNGVRLDPDNG